MADERRSPSGGWRQVYREMAVEGAVETEPTPRCPDCGRPGERVAGDVYRCERGEHHHNCDRYWRSE